MANAPTRTELQKASAAATAWLTNGKGYKVERRDDNGNTIDTLYMDTPDIDTAVNVLRIGQSGIGFSRSGVNGPYYSAWTLDGTFDASVINVINLVAEKLRSVAGNSELSVDGAELRYLVEGNETIMMSSSNIPILYMTDYEGSDPTNNSELTPHHLKLGGTSINPVLEIQTLRGVPTLNLESTGYKTLSWKSNGDGTYTLIGQ
jgi:hypothetical protein